MNICIFGSSSETIDQSYLESAEHLGKSIAKKGIGVVFGAGKYGVMGAVARGVSAENGVLIGVSPRFFIEMDVLYEKCFDLIYTDTMRERKAIMENKSDAFIVCAGGIGTFEEFFEIITLKQLGRHSKPIIIYNLNGYYDSMLAMMSHAVNEGFMTDDVFKLISVANTEQEIFEQLDGYTPFGYNKYN